MRFNGDLDIEHNILENLKPKSLANKYRTGIV